MRWQGQARSTHVEDRRGMGGGGMVMGGGIGGIILLLIFTFLGGDPSEIINSTGTSGYETGSHSAYVETDQDKELSQFVSVVLKDTEDVWTDVFRKNGMEYRPPTLVLYSGSVQSACGAAGAAMGPFYCPGDEKLYIDLSFYDELSQRFHAPGDFAMAYVIAHEVGHHVQKLLGISDQVASLRNRLSEKEYNKYSVRLELQADYFAGVWANHAQGMDLLEPGDIDEALTAASAVGDDTIQMQARGYVVPESFTHGTAAQRQRWFEKGYELGTIEGGNTFDTENL